VLQVTHQQRIEQTNTEENKAKIMESLTEPARAQEREPELAAR
jgi:hypothetical protein